MPRPLLVASLALAVPAFASTLSGDTGTRNGFSMYKPGEAVPLVFTATGASGQTLTVTTQDAEGATVATQTATVNADPWTGTVSGYNGKLGFFRVYAQLTDGTYLPQVGSRGPPDAGTAPSFLTYAIVPDPALRANSPPEDQTFFSMQGGFNAAIGSDIMAFLGVHWTLDGSWTWSALESSPNARNTFQPTPAPTDNWATNGNQPWTLYTLPNLTKNGRPYQGQPDVYLPGTFSYNTGALDPTYDPDWTNFVTHVVQTWPTVYPNRARRYYEVTWEPQYPWGYAGTPEQLSSLYTLAYSAMKAADSNALAVAPTLFINTPGAIAYQDSFYDAGLGHAVDVISCHTYMDNDLGYGPIAEPELSGQPSNIATLRRHVTSFAGRALPMIGTEQGYKTRQDITQEIFQARRLVRDNLLLLGEGWKLNTAFYFADYPGTDSENHLFYWDYGLFYNLDEATFGGYGPGKVSPKPVAASYAAMTFLVDGRQSVNNVNWLADTVRGYVFEKYGNPSDDALVLWDFTGGPTPVQVNAGVAGVDVYDFMGNKQTLAISDGMLSLDLTDEPTYVLGVAPGIWGSQRRTANVAQGRPVTTSGDEDGGSGSLAVDGDPWSNESRWVSAFDAGAEWISVDLGAPQPVQEVRFFSGTYQAGSGTNFYNTPLPSYRIQRWTDGGWSDVVARSNNTRAAVSETFAPVTTSQVRLAVDPGATPQVQLYELEVIAAVAPDAGVPDGGAGSDAGSSPRDSGAPDGGQSPGSVKGCGCESSGNAAALLLGVLLVCAAHAHRQNRLLRRRARRELRDAPSAPRAPLQ